MKKKILLFIVIVAAVAAGIGYFVWNKPHETVDNKEGLKITAEALAAAFEQDEQKANATYLNQVLEVNGKISELTKNQEGKDVVLLESSDPFSGVLCTMKEGTSLQLGQVVTIKGFCNGFTTAVLLSDCIIAN